MIRFAILGRRLLPSFERLQRTLGGFTRLAGEMLDAFDFWLDVTRVVVAKLAKRCRSGINCGVGKLGDLRLGQCLFGIPLIRVFQSRVKCIHNGYSGLKRVPPTEARPKLRSVQKISGGLNFSTEFDRARLGLRVRGID